MPKLTLFTQAAKDSTNEAMTTENMVNLFVEANAGDSKSFLTARSHLGSAAFADIAVGPVRAVQRIGEYVFIASNRVLFRVDRFGEITNLGEIRDSVETSISGNTGEFVTVAAGGRYYVWDGSTLSQPTGGRFAGGASVTQNDFDTIISQPNGREVEWTANADPTTRSAVSFRTKESRTDNVLRVMASNNLVYVLGEESTEIWYNTGASGANRYQRLADGVRDEGLLAYNLATTTDNAIFLIGDDGVCKLLAGGQFLPLSTPAVQSDIEESTPIRVDYFEERGEKFHVVVFSDRPAWIYDARTQLWSRRASGVNFDAWDCSGIAEAWGSFYKGTNGGNLERMVRNNADVGQPLKRRVVSKPLTADGRKFSVQKLQFIGRVGRADIGREAQVTLRVSWDGGNTWSLPVTRSLGALGQYFKQAEFRQLGRGEEFTAEFAITDPADIHFASDAYVTIT